MDMRRTMICTLICLLVATFCLETRAEVSVRTDRSGNYVKTQIIPVGPNAENRAWGLRGRGFRGFRTLNPYGDINGDLWPTVAETPTAPHYPYVVWSRFNGSNYDMAWSRWTGEGWTPINYIAREPMPGDDLDADVIFNPEGRPYVVWWSDMEEGGGRVYFSLLLSNRWLMPVLVSDPAVDSRFPKLELTTSRELAVTYETPEGSVTQFITFGSPNTIVDDSDPQSRRIWVNLPTAVGNPDG
jgi:hypothetical protein